MFCTSSHILGETCECSAPLSTYWHGHANIMHLSAHIRKSMPIYCSTWHIFTGLSEYIRRSIPMFCYYWHGIRPQVEARVGNRPPPMEKQIPYNGGGGGAFCYFIFLCGTFSTMGGGGFFLFFSPCICLFLFLLESFFELAPPPPHYENFCGRPCLHVAFFQTLELICNLILIK